MRKYRVNDNQIRHLRLQALAIVIAVALVHAAPAQRTHSSSVSADDRTIVHNAINSPSEPAARFVIDPRLRFVGRQKVNLYGNAEAEQFIFVSGGNAGSVERFLWVQFEHFLPTNSMHYEAGGAANTSIGDLSFAYDVWAYTNYGVAIEDPKSDGGAAAALLASQGVSFPKRVVRVRLFHFPTEDRRSEVMIIYGEAAPESSSIPVTGNRVSLDKTAPAAAAILLARARAAITAQQLSPIVAVNASPR